MSLVRVVGLMSLLAAAAASFATPTGAFKSGGWEGGANRDETGRFSDCTMTANYRSSITLGFIISRDFGWGLVLVNDKWKLDVGSAQPVTLAIDSREPIPSTAKVVDVHGILVPLENEGPVVNAMRDGRRLAVVTPSGKISFRLTGTRAAIATLAGCVSDNLEGERAAGGTAAFAALEAKPPGENQDNANRLFAGSEAVVFASNLLASAGITNYQLIDPAKNPMPNFDVVWTYANGIIGAIVGYKDMGAVDLDEAATGVMADDSKVCKGDFSSGKKSSEAANVRRLFTACRTDGKSIEIHYTLVKTESGHMIQLAHLKPSGATGDIANADSAFLQAAVLQSFK